MSDLSAPADKDGESAAIDGAKAEPDLRLELFGGPLLWRNDESVRLSPLQAGLFALGFSDRTGRVPRALTQHLLWESRDQKVVRHRLSQLIYQTNQTLGERVFKLNGEEIRVGLDLVRCDLDEFRALLAAEDFGRARAVSERGFLSACGYRKTDAFADWIEEQRLQKRLLLRRAALAVWETAAREHNWVRARRAAQVLLHMEPTAEELLRRVMWARAMSGQVREAEVEYQRFARRASPNGPWTPEPATTRILHGVHNLTFEEPEPQPDANGGDPSVHEATEFVGRPRELALLGGALFGDADQGEWRTVSVSGEVGIGKTRLVREVLRGAGFRGYHVLQTRASLLEREIALGSILEALAGPWAQPVLRSLNEPWRTTALALLPELHDPESDQFQSAVAAPGFEPGSNGVDWPSRPICEALLHLFEAVSRQRPTILFVDSIQWLDSASIGVLQFLRTRWNGGPFTLLMTHSAEDLRPDCSATHFVHEVEYGADPFVIRLRELDREHAVALARSVSPFLSEARQRQIAETAGGNPRFVLDLAREWSDAGPKRRTPQAPVPSSVRHLVARRLEVLNRAPQKVLFALAVIGETAPLGLLRRVAEVGRESCLDALDALHRHGLASWTPEGAGFRRPIFAAAAYREIHPSRRSVLHARAARLMQSTAKGASALEVARHYHLAGKRRHANECVTKAIAATADLAIPRRVAVLEKARDVSTGAQRSTVLAGLARLYHDLCSFAAALSCGELALRDPAALAATDGIRARCLVADARNRLGLKGVVETLREFDRLEESAKALEADSLRAEIRDARVQLLSRAGMRDALRAELEELRKDEAGWTPEVRCRILATLTLEAAHANAEEVIECGGRAVELADSVGLPAVAALARQRQSSALMTAGLLGQASGWTRFCDLRAATEEAGQSGLLALMLLDLATWYVVTGDYDVAQRTVAEVAEISGEMDCPEIRARELVVKAGLAVARRNPRDARAVLAAIKGSASGKEDAPRTPPPPPRYLGALAAAEGLLRMELGKLKGLSRIAEKHPLGPHLDEADFPSILFHTRLHARTGDPEAAMDILAPALEANRTRRPVIWVKLALELVRLARRMREPRPELAREARDRARELGLAGLANELLAFCRPDDMW